MRIIARGTGNLSTILIVTATFRSRLIGQHLQDASRDLATSAFELGGHGACHDTVFRAPSVYQVSSSYAF